MPQIFRPASNTVARAMFAGIPLAFAGALLALTVGSRSDWATGAGMAPAQPIPFSHEHHAGELGIDCRFCHWAVEHGPIAGLPSTETCMVCHGEIFGDAEMLRPVRESFRTGTPIEWARVYDLPDYTYFDHSIHVHAGVACVTCHGRVDRMPLTTLALPLHMAWCLDCHRHPERYLRPRARVFDAEWRPRGDREAIGRRLVRELAIRVEQLDDCSVCHR